ncbi:MAG TPA: hypothetical protein PLY40_02165, partial [Bacillota bacterium]|nr:hypothetical protein [Bacillota bacterium]
ITSACMAHQHNIIAQSPIDINICKQLNILIAEMSTAMVNRIVIDPTIAALGYGIEYSYSIMERASNGALQGDKMLAMPMIGNIGAEAWRAKEANISAEDEPGWGEQEERGIMWESTTAMAYLQSGMNILVMRHPRSVELIKGQIDDLMNEIRARVEKGQRTLVTTLTKKMAEDLTDYLLEMGFRVRYLHS